MKSLLKQVLSSFISVLQSLAQSVKFEVAAKKGRERQWLGFFIDLLIQKSYAKFVPGLTPVAQKKSHDIRTAGRTDCSSHVSHLPQRNHKVTWTLLKETTAHYERKHQQS
jgi:hypothetical protein